jgi:hypothetical protein
MTNLPSPELIPVTYGTSALDLSSIDITELSVERSSSLLTFNIDTSKYYGSEDISVYKGCDTYTKEGIEVTENDKKKR